ncbi:MAG: GGDEF domain-containing protein, partial [Deltaproteobacteria bacterium]|nr:GGDEF domain-containing protein [Deltaproteobacteria bacterium]
SETLGNWGLVWTGGQSLEVHTLRKSGEAMIGQYSSEALVINGEECILSSIKDVTEESQMRQKLLDLATKDTLTNLPNRRLFYERFAIARLNAERRRFRMAVMSVDLDKFKAVNDGFGHAVGDAVLVEAAQRFLDCLRKVDVVARFGGDEFVILLTEIHEVEDAVHVANKVVAAFRKPFDALERRVEISSSIGIAIFPDHGIDLEELLRISDEALYQTKEAGRDGYCLSELPYSECSKDLT